MSTHANDKKTQLITRWVEQIRQHLPEPAAESATPFTREHRPSPRRRIGCSLPKPETRLHQPGQVTAG